MNVVNNGKATTYVFGRKKIPRGDNEETRYVGPSVSFTLLLAFSTLDDHDVEVFVIGILSSAPTAEFDVLDLRREFPEAICPDTRQLNKVVYIHQEATNVGGGLSGSLTNKDFGTHVAEVGAFC